VQTLTQAYCAPTRVTLGRAFYLRLCMSTWHQCFTYDPSPYCSDPPNQPGVYIIYLINYILGRRRLVYIGSAKNLRKRLNRHTHGILKRNHIHPYLPIVFAKETDTYLSLEKRLIKKLKPILNKNFK
jgi:excinuclease UvrABC nuclease subunit